MDTKNIMDDVMEILLSKLDEAIDDMEKGRGLSSFLFLLISIHLHFRYIDISSVSDL